MSALWAEIAVKMNEKFGLDPPGILTRDQCESKLKRLVKARAHLC